MSKSYSYDEPKEECFRWRRGISKAWRPTKGIELRFFGSPEITEGMGRGVDKAHSYLGTCEEHVGTPRHGIFGGHPCQPPAQPPPWRCKEAWRLISEFQLLQGVV